MRFKQVMYCWTPINSTSKPNTVGQVEVGPHPDKTGWSKIYSYSAGACFSVTQELSEHEQATQILIDFHTMVVRDGIDPQRAHQEFLKIDEYRRLITRNIEGAED
jgi:hypothetical protein